MGTGSVGIFCALTETWKQYIVLPHLAIGCSHPRFVGGAQISEVREALSGTRSGFGHRLGIRLGIVGLLFGVRGLVSSTVRRESRRSLGKRDTARQSLSDI